MREQRKVLTMDKRFWQCNLQDNGVNHLGHIMTGSVNINQSVNAISVSSFQSTTFDHPIII
ncbi:hypothetical protein Hanom_Chr04g00291351 [Helianthus anomalus]